MLYVYSEAKINFDVYDLLQVVCWRWRWSGTYLHQTDWEISRNGCHLLSRRYYTYQCTIQYNVAISVKILPFVKDISLYLNIMFFCYDLVWIYIEKRKCKHFCNFNTIKLFICNLYVICISVDKIQSFHVFVIMCIHSPQFRFQFEQIVKSLLRGIQFGKLYSVKLHCCRWPPWTRRYWRFWWQVEDSLPLALLWLWHWDWCL